MRALLLLTLLVGCSKDNPYYCPDNIDDNCNNDADIDTPMGCTTAAQCTNAAKPICEPMAKVCVACTADNVGSCSGTTPVCSAANACAPCTAHNQCGSEACLPDGSCALETQVAYVSSTGDDTNACTATSPCKRINHAATKGLSYIKVMNDLDEAVVLDGVNVTILAEPGTAVRRSTTGAIFDLRGTSTITIRDLTIRDALGATTGHGIVVGDGVPVTLTLDGVAVIGNAGSGLSVLGGVLTMSRSVIAGNSGGGAKIATSFNVTNSLFANNGSGTSTYGGLHLTPSASVTFKFNTVANNTASATPKGIYCASAVTSSNTIISGNDVSVNCVTEYSLFDSLVNVTGSNRAGDAKFKNTNPIDPRAADFYRIQPSSDAVDQGDPASTMMTDIDGDARPQGNAPDIGADEVP